MYFFGHFVAVVVAAVDVAVDLSFLFSEEMMLDDAINALDEGICFE